MIPCASETLSWQRARREASSTFDQRSYSGWPLHMPVAWIADGCKAQTLKSQRLTRGLVLRFRETLLNLETYKLHQRWPVIFVGDANGSLICTSASLQQFTYIQLLHFVVVVFIEHDAFITWFIRRMFYTSLGELQQAIALSEANKTCESDVDVVKRWSITHVQILLLRWLLL